MAIRAQVAVWLACQLLAAVTAVTADPESCTEANPQSSSNEAALLQKSVGSHRVTVAEITDDMVADAENATAQTPATQPDPRAGAVEAEPKSAPPASESAQSQAAPEVGVVEPAQQLAAQPAGQAVTSVAQVVMPKTPDPEKVALTAVEGASFSSQEVTEGIWLHLTRSSVVSVMQRVHAQFPDSIVRMFPSLRTDIGAAFGLSLISCVIWSTLVVAFACLYRSQKSFPQAVSSRPEQDFNDWTSGPFDVFSDLRVCCWSCWCPCIRWADNMDMLGILGFWVGLSMFCGLILLLTIPGGLLLWLVAALLWMSFRQQLRLKFDMEQNTVSTFMSDWALYCCCWPCAISQEARHIEEACRAAHKACRKLEQV